MKKFSLLFVLISLLLPKIKTEDLYVDETGETDFIPIESEPEIQRFKRQVEDYDESYKEDYSDYGNSEESESSGDAMYDLDGYDTEDDSEDPYNEVTPVMPSRVVPTLVSPSFDDPGGFGNVIVSKSLMPKQTAFEVIKTALFDDESEGKFLIFLMPQMKMSGQNEPKRSPLLSKLIKGNLKYIRVQKDDTKCLERSQKTLIIRKMNIAIQIIFCQKVSKMS